MFKKALILSVALLTIGASAGPVFAQSAPQYQSSRLFGSQASAGRTYRQNVVHIKLQSSAGLTLQNGVFNGGPADQTAQLNAILAGARRVKVDKIAAGASANAAQQRVRTAVKDYYKVTFAANIDVVAIADQLQALNGVIASAYPEPIAAPSPVVPSFVSLENFLQASPAGTDANYASTFPGGKGGNTRIVDIEYSWNRAHTDLTAKAANALVQHGVADDPFNDNNHGTAVLGELIGTANTFGVTGAAPSANLTLINANSTTYGYDVAGALADAAGITSPGDVVLIEQQAYGPNSNYVPVEWVPEVYDAIKSLTASGVTVIEPAANGSQNLDDASTFGAPFPQGKPDSGAIIVGAGESCTGASGRLSRLYFSNFGARVNLQGPGDCVTSTGYGDLYSASGVNNYYTQSFNGTSSASPVVAAAASALSSAYKQLNGGSVLTPVQIRSYLQQTGAPQVNDPFTGTLNGNIGQLPNLAKALLKADLTAPTVSTLKSSLVNHKPVLTWTAATDNVKVVSYNLYRGGTLYKTIASPSLTFTDTAAVKGKTYKYQVAAVDEAGRVSAKSNTVSIVVK